MFQKKTTQPLTAHAGKNPRTLNAYCVKATTQLVTKVSIKIWSTKQDFLPHCGEKW
jgi:hypothetical protein